MNCFAHGFRFVDRPWFLVGTALPDWLSLVDRKVRVREKRAREFANSAHPAVRQMARGIISHHQDDRRFHDHSDFIAMNMTLAVELRDLLGPDAGFRPHFVAHVVIEMLLDDALSLKNPGLLDRYYQAVETVCPEQAQRLMNRLSNRPTDRLAAFIRRFLEDRYLFDYASDPGIRYRMNRILDRVGLPELPKSFLNWLPAVRSRVYRQSEQLLRQTSRLQRADSS